MLRDRIGARARQFNVITMHAIEFNAQAGDAGAEFFAGFHIQQKLPGIFLQIA